MSDRLPQVKPHELIKALEKAGWERGRSRGSHQIMVNEKLRRAIPVPVHNRDLKIGTLRSIMRSASMSRDDLRRLLKK